MFEKNRIDVIQIKYYNLMNKNNFPTLVGKYQIIRLYINKHKHRKYINGC